MLASSEEVRERILRQFEKIYVINLPYRTDRKRQIEKQLNKTGLSLSDEAVVLFEAVRPDTKGKWPSIGAQGCFFSHLTLLKDAAQNGYQSILILEDDADWSEGFLSNATEVLDQLEALDWAFLHGGLGEDQGFPRFQMLDAGKEIKLAHCIGISGNIVPKIAAYLEVMAAREPGDPRGGPMHVDGAYNWFRKDHPIVASYVAAPSIAKQRPSRTDIHDLHWSDRLPLVSTAKNALRPLVNIFRKSLR